MILTNSGKLVNPFNLHEQDVSMNDIACSLAGQPRFSGHTGTTYSVAEHSVIVMCKVILLFKDNTKDLTFSVLKDALMHDATEAYFSDIPSPIKRGLDAITNSAIHNLEDSIWKIIAYKYDLSETLSDCIKIVDREVLINEIFTFFPNGDTFIDDDFGFNTPRNYIYSTIVDAADASRSLYYNDSEISEKMKTFLISFFDTLIPYAYGDPCVSVYAEPLSKEDSELLFLETWRLLNII